MERDDFVAAHVRGHSLEAEHGRHRGAVDVAVHETDLRASSSEPHGEIQCNG